MLPTALLVAIALASRASSLPHEPRRPVTPGFEWDLSKTPSEWFESNRHDLERHHELALQTRSEEDDETLFQKRNWQIPTDGLPPLPLTFWVVSNASGLPTLANAAVRRMQTWYFENTNVYNMTSWWQHPYIMNAYIDLDAATGTNTNEQVVRRILDNNDRGVGYMIDKYIDDQAWWGLTLAKAYQQYGVADYLSAAKAIQADDTSAYSSDCGGGIVWLTYKPSIKNTVTNTLHIALSAKLYKITGQAQYLSQAQSTLKWWLGWAYDENTGAVYDTITSPGCNPQNPDLYTYNSGIILGGLVDLFSTTKNQTYIDIANKIAFHGISKFSNGQGIMRETCEHDGPLRDADNGGLSSADGTPKNNLPAGCQNDNIMFKGIFAQNLGYLYSATNDPQLLNYLTINALSAAFYNMDNTFLFGEWWDGPFNKTLANVLTHGCALGLMSSSVAVNLAKDASNRVAQNLPELVFTNQWIVPLPSGGVSEADSTGLRKRWTARRTALPRP